MVFDRKWAHHIGFDNIACTLILSTLNTCISIITSNKTYIMELSINHNSKTPCLGVLQFDKTLCPRALPYIELPSLLLPPTYMDMKSESMI